MQRRTPTVAEVTRVTSKVTGTEEVEAMVSKGHRPHIRRIRVVLSQTSIQTRTGSVEEALMTLTSTTRTLTVNQNKMTASLQLSRVVEEVKVVALAVATTLTTIQKEVTEEHPDIEVAVEEAFQAKVRNHW